ncbi:transposase [Streptomyces sp. NPDC060064]|uniref:transposase n=1 Tax=Streptomyces sp. NPDC060064 TaxID=3347049 RepID=UPI0036B904B7
MTVTTTDGHHVQGRYRLLTTLLDHRIDPAEQLVRLYHEPWEIESAFHSLRHTLLTGRVLRSGDPAGVEQEMWALLTTYQLLRIAMVAAIESAPGLDPDRTSFTIALEAARNLLIAGRGVVLTSDDIDLVGDIGRAVLADLPRPAARGPASTRSSARSPATPPAPPTPGR